MIFFHDMKKKAQEGKAEQRTMSARERERGKKTKSGMRKVNGKRV